MSAWFREGLAPEGTVSAAIGRILDRLQMTVFPRRPRKARRHAF